MDRSHLWFGGVTSLSTTIEAKTHDVALFTTATVLYLLFLPLYPITASLMGEMTSATVVASAAVVTALVTLVYAALTLLLWRETRAAARTAAEQIRLTRIEQGLRLRPYVNVLIETALQDGLRYRAMLHNVGPVLAPVKYRVYSVLNDHKVSGPEEQNILFPGESTHGVWRQLADAGTWAALQSGQARLHLAVHVEYSGPWPGEAYRTAVGWAFEPPDSLHIDEVDVT